MTVAEIAQKAWGSFCKRIQEACRGSMVSIEHVQSDGTRSTLVQDSPLLRVALNADHSACNQNLIFETGNGAERPFRHIVVEPIHIRLSRNGEGDRYTQLQIPAENGTTVVKIHPGITPALCEDLQGVS